MRPALLWIGFFENAVFPNSNGWFYGVCFFLLVVGKNGSGRSFSLMWGVIYVWGTVFLCGAKSTNIVAVWGWVRCCRRAVVEMLFKFL